MTAVRVLMMSCLWMTSRAVLPVLKLKTFEGAGDVMIGYEMRVIARSAIHCVIVCRTYPHCISAAYDAETSSCFLHPQTTTSKEHFGELQNSNHSHVLVFTDSDPDCSESSFNVTYESVTTRRSLWSVEGNVTCNDDYYPPLVPVRCLKNEIWTPPSIVCQKRIWRYPETNMTSLTDIIFPIPGTVIKGWSMCVEGVPTKYTRVIVQIYYGSSLKMPVHTSWWLSLNEVVFSDLMNNMWGTSPIVTNPPFPLKVGKPFFFRLTVNTSTTVDIYMDNIFFYRYPLRYTLSSFTHISVQMDVNLTKVEAWCPV